MSKWRAYNDNKYPFTQMFKDQQISIQPGSYWEFDDYDEAHQFKCAFSPVKEAADGTHDPRGFKIIRLVPESTVQAQVQPTKFISPMDGRVFNTEAELNAYLDANFKDQVFKDDALEQEILAKRDQPPHLKGKR